MPRKRQAPLLELLCMSYIVDRVLQLVESHSGDQIRAIVEDIPQHLANRYVAVLILGASQRRWDFPAGVELRDAFHPMCDTICWSQEEDETPFMHEHHVLRQLFVNLDTMPELTVLNVEMPQHLLHVVDVDYQAMSNGIRCLSKLRFVQMPVVIPEASEVIEAASQCLSRLQEIVLIGCVAPEHLRVLANCSNLRTVLVVCPNMSGEDAIYMLDNLPLLDSFSVHNVRSVLPLCQRAYPLKDMLDLAVVESHLIQKLVQSFPSLKKLRLRRSDTDNVADINSLVGLENFGIKFVPEQDASVLSTLEPTFARVAILTIIGITGFERALGCMAPNLSTLNIATCTGVNLECIANTCPNLTEFRTFEIEVTPMSHSPPASAFRNLRLVELYGSDTVTSDHVMFVLSSCPDLVSLDAGCDCIDELLVSRLLDANPMDELNALKIMSNGLTNVLSILGIIFKNFPSLRAVDLSGSQMTDLTPEERLQILEMMEDFDSIYVKVRGDIISPRTSFDEITQLSSLDSVLLNVE